LLAFVVLNLELYDGERKIRRIDNSKLYWKEIKLVFDYIILNIK
jgi:hypothetical protein